MHYDEAIQHCIFRYVSGSRAYGTERPDSDTDYRGIFIAPLVEGFRLYVGQDEDGAMKFGAQQVEKPGDDEVLYEVRRFLKLAADCNPNIVEALFVDRGITHTSPVWERIREQRHLFVSKKARHTFGGYAHAQLKRIRGHRGYLLNPPNHKPTREEFGLEPNPRLPGEKRRAILSIGLEFVAPGIFDEVKKEQAYEDAVQAWKSYQKWDRERNPARKALEAKFGFDVKHAMHLVRLLRMGLELLETGETEIYRSDKDELRGILRGEWTYDRLEAYADEMDAKLEEAYERSTLQYSPERKEIEAIYLTICREHYGISL